MKDKGNILVIDDELIMRDLLEDLLKEKGYKISTAQSGEEGLEASKKKKFDLTIVDLKMPGIGGMGVLEWAKKHDPDSMVIIITAFGSLESAQNALRLGAYDYITKPFSIEHISFAVKRAIDSRSLLITNKTLMKDLEKKVEERTKELVLTHKKLQDVSQKY